MAVDIPRTYMTSVRADIRDLAVIAKFLADNNFDFSSKTKGILALHAFRLLADYLRGLNPKYDVTGTEKAIEVLRSLGYGESVVSGRRDYKALLKQMAKENLQMELMPRQSDNFGIFKARKNIKPFSADTAGIKEILAPETESPQLKVRTSEDEKTDLSKIRTTMNVPDGAPIEVLEENKPTPEHSEYPESQPSEQP